jgi:Protein of unknown function (DUF4236)
MGFRLRRSIKLFPGVRLNLSKSGVSASLGRKGFTTNIRPGRATRTTVGMPGTGISYTSTAGSTPAPDATKSSGWWLLAVLVVVILLVAFA